MSDDRLYFSLGAIALRTAKGLLVASSRVTASLVADISAPLVSSMGGAVSYPVGARPGRSSGELTLTLNSRPRWVDTLLNEGDSTDTAASASTAIGTLTNVVGTAMAGKTTIAEKSGSTAKQGLYNVLATSTTAVTVTRAGPDGTDEWTVTGVSSTAKDIGDSGLTLAASAAYVAKNAIAFEVTPSHGGYSVIKIPQVRAGTEYELVAYSALGGAGDTVEKLTLHRVILGGAAMAFTDNEPSNGVEIKGVILAPTDGSEVATRQTLKKA